jgi:phage regulator Rha-like protein
MNDVMNMNQQAEKTMSSQEIAELTGKMHKNVMADVRRMLSELDIDSAEISPWNRALFSASFPRSDLI